LGNSKYFPKVGDEDYTPHTTLHNTQTTTLVGFRVLFIAKMPLSDFRVAEELGKGSFASVYKVIVKFFFMCAFKISRRLSENLTINATR
jgi:hypothetical protein